VGQLVKTATVSRVQEGARLELVGVDAFGALVQTHQQRIYRVLLGMLGDADAAETLTQECFLKAYQHRAAFRGEGSVAGWLLKIAINLARDHGRSRWQDFWRKLVAGGKDAAELADKRPDPRPSPERELLAREELAAVWSAVEMLSAQQRAVFVLRFVEEMTLEQIAEATSLKTGTVKIHLFRALGAIRRRLKEGRKHERSP
jgi:RNA polymerase sigma-70 factor (ECF subfamily)